ncbi:uncharacterized protein N7498_010175 [Penicillium cinerascens]|uniref:Cytokinesis regulator n=1 Tax=Penicillium cinerascens TaxID=70096 RepID=A0A9W9JA85_9EURO|nr:uncharacterized protein N7498_010175 [Penicillium cinerascens]KAJ5191190.1 hypothetical protein N7498_010175 [Penicillium cinerascens]
MDSPMGRTRLNVDETIECWDDDDDLQINDGIQFRAPSSAGSFANSSIRPSGHRDSISSRRSARSDLESNAGDEDWQVLLPYTDDFSKEEALASAKNAGIPLPADIPSSALLGGAIKRLSARKTKRTFVDDWSDEVELPGPDAVLELKLPQDSRFPDTLQQISSAATSPVKSTASPSWNGTISTRLQSALATLDRFQDENEAPLNQDVPTIKAPTSRSPRKTAVSATSGGPAVQQEDEDFDQDLELPPDHQPLQLTRRKDHTGVSSPTLEDFDIEWSEGSIGVRVGGTTRDGRSVPSSTMSIASPSVSSCITGESEDDGLDGLVFPDGPVDFNASLRKRHDSQVTDVPIAVGESQDASHSRDADDFFSGIEVDNGKAFASGKLTLNPNVKCKTEWPASPTRRSATTLTFTNGPITNASDSPRTRIPRLSGHDRTHSTHLETVSESGAPLSKFRRSQSRLGHSTQSSVSSVPATDTPSTSPKPLTSGRRILSQRDSRDPVTASASKAPNRHLRTKRSMPVVRGGGGATLAQSSQRSSSHPDGPVRHASFNRPKTPVERTSNEGRSSGSGRRAQAPFIPAGSSERQSHHNSVKSYLPSRRTNSDGSGDLLNPQGILTRLSRSTRPEALRLSFGDSGIETASSAAKRTLTRPARRRNFGDGTELESFDDLPTSASTESKFVKNPAGRGAPRSVRTRLSQSRITPPIESPTQSSTPPSTWRLTPTPRFARDTNASRNAREQRIASLNSKSRDSNPLTSYNSNWKAHPISRISPNSAPVRSRKPNATTKSTSKPHLIKPIGSGVQESKSVRGMRYNPTKFRWEGNENLVQDFDVVAGPKSPKPAPALITNVGTVQNVQAGGVMSEDEDDVFAGLDDLEDKAAGATGGISGALEDFNSHPAGDDPSAGESSDEGPITEEFDVGPEFIRRQRAEEEKWRRKVDKWIGSAHGDRETHWRWAIRDLVADDTGYPAA